MQNYVIFTDSTADLPQDIAESLDINVIPMELTVDDDGYFEDKGIDFKKFYKDLKTGKLPKTTCTNTQKFIECFEPHLKNGEDVLYVCFSSGLSRTYECAVLAKKELNQKYQKNSVVVVDSLAASLGQGLLVYRAAKMKEENKRLAEVEDFLEKCKKKAHHWFTVDDLFHLKRGGRISACSATIGTVLGVKPILNINQQGGLVAQGKIRGRRASLLALVDEMEKAWDPGENDTVFISHSDSYDDASFVADELKKRFNVSNVVLSYIGPTIGSHTGAGTVALFFFGKSER